jgi:UDP-galactopyranose mutase
MINKEINAEMIINTIPWLEFRESSSIPLEIKNSIDQLKFSSIDVSYNSSTQPTNAFWSYFSDVRLPYHRVLYRQNFITGAKGYWEETNSKRIKEGQLITYHNKYAYPLNTLGKPEAIKNVLKWAGSRSIIGLGRWGEWEHMNSDVAIEKALQLAESLVPE